MDSQMLLPPLSATGRISATIHLLPYSSAHRGDAWGSIFAICGDRITTTVIKMDAIILLWRELLIMRQMVEIKS